jgi:1,4-alpha-glucan branching enzyme
MNHAQEFGPQDLHLFNEGTHYALWQKLGAHLGQVEGVSGAFFAVWAPNAERVTVTGDFCNWELGKALAPLQSSGIWTGFVPGIQRGDLYKYRVFSRFNGFKEEKCDPFGVRHEVPPSTASIVWDLEYAWGDAEWMSERHRHHHASAPISIYEVHLGSWMRVPEEQNRSLTYREIAPLLADYVKRMGFTHVEFLPLMEHPFFGSWGYQLTGFFAATGRYGTPQDLMFLIDYLHQHQIGVILDWVPSHFPTDGHGLQYFDGTHLYEHADPRLGFHPDWQSSIFNYGRNEVRAFLMSSAMFWLSEFHADGLRVDGVASMLYLNYSRKEGEWIPNIHGGNENLEALAFLRQLNTACYAAHPDILMIAEESTAWGGVSRPVQQGGLGFGYKWDMGWMHDTLKYLERDPIYRQYHHSELTFRAIYALHENFILPLSHDEVVYGKGSLIRKMPGDDWQRFANLRLLYSYMWAMPGKKLLFMGGEFAQWDEWQHDASLQWELAEFERHYQVRNMLGELNMLLRTRSALHTHDFEKLGFEWVRIDDAARSLLIFLRKGRSERDWLLAAFNFTPVLREAMPVGLPMLGGWREIFNSDAKEYGGSGAGNAGYVEARHESADGRPFMIEITLPPLGAVFFEPA